MSLPTGVLKVQCTNDLKDEISKSGRSACVLIMDEIKNMDNVADVWFVTDDRIDIIVEVDVKDRQSANTSRSEISRLDGVYEVHPSISSELN